MNTSKDLELFCCVVAGLALLAWASSCSHQPRRFITDPSHCKTLHRGKIECEEWHPPMPA